MPLPPRRGLGDQVRRALPYIESGMRRGLSQSSLRRTLGESGFRVSRSELSDAIGYLESARRGGDLLRSTRMDRRVNASRLPEARTTMLRRYSFVFDVTGIDEASGIEVHRHVTISSSDLMTRGDLEAEVEALVTDPEHYDPITVTDITPIRGVRSGAGGTIFG